MYTRTHKNKYIFILIYMYLNLCLMFCKFKFIFNTFYVSYTIFKYVGGLVYISANPNDGMFDHRFVPVITIGQSLEAI